MRPRPGTALPRRRCRRRRGIERVAIRPGITAVTPLDFVHYPYSHSLAAAIVWAFAVGSAYLAIRRDRVGAI